MDYAYVRVSTIGQNIARQMEEMKRLRIPKENIYVDKQSGKDFERQSYQELLRVLKPGDLLTIKAIDRLGRNYEMITKEWKYITKVIKADIRVIDMPLLDTQDRPDNLVGKFISDIVLQLLSFVAENERENIRQRQKEGIKIAKNKGVKFGRPEVKLIKNANEIFMLYKNGTISCKQAYTKLNVSKSTFFRIIKRNKSLYE